MTLSVDKLVPWTSASELRHTTPTEVYKGPRKRPTRYPRPASVYIRKDGYSCLTLKTP